MSPSAVSPLSVVQVPPGKVTNSAPDDYLLDRDLNFSSHYAVASKGNYLILDDGRKVFDACGGAAVACLGYGNKEVIEAMTKQSYEVPYCHSMFFKTHSTEGLAEELIASTGKRLERVFLISSGLFFKPYYHDC